MYLKNLEQLSINDVKSAGGKAAALGELARLKINVPAGFVVLAGAFDKFLEENNLDRKIEKILEKMNRKDINSISKASVRIKKLFGKADIPKDIALETSGGYKKLKTPLVAVRSSATAEDSARASWAGQLESYLDVSGKNLLKSVKKCWQSLFSPRAIAYGFSKSSGKRKISTAVIIQQMVRSEVSGVCFTAHPIAGNKKQLIVEAGFGLGVAVVSGRITPDSYVVQKNPRRIVDKNIQTKQILSDEKILELSRIVVKIERHFKKPQDIEWAFAKGKFHILQSRPITTL